jgi:hypothetical protein
MEDDMRLRLIPALLVGALALSSGPASADEGTESLEELAVETASTPAQHAALARYYHEKAQEARAEARRHEVMGRAYTGGKSPQKQVFKQHCQGISEKYAAMAAEYDALAKLHEADAGKAP